jgi:hypothetical protein
MPINKYDQIHQDLMHLLLNGEMHSTLVGKQITLGGSKESSKQQADEFAIYIVNLLKKAEQFRKDNVKKSKK